MHGIELRKKPDDPRDRVSFYRVDVTARKNFFTKKIGT